MKREPSASAEALADMRRLLHRVLGPEAGTDLTERLLAFTKLVREWNDRGNLVSSRDAERLLARHVPESLEFVARIRRYRPRSILDIGSGAGFPGIPIALAMPESLVALLESRRLKSLFLLRAVRELEIENGYVWCARAESLAARVAAAPADMGRDPHPSSTGPALLPLAGWSHLGIEPPEVIPAFELVTARAVAPLVDLVRFAGPFLGPGGRLVTAKGSRLRAELAGLEQQAPGWVAELADRSSGRVPQIVILRRQ